MQLERQKSVPTQNNNENISLLEKYGGFAKGVTLTLVLALISGQLAKLPVLSIMGIMIISIIIGMTWKSLIGVQVKSLGGITFSSKILLRAGIILMGLRLNLSQIASAGMSVILIDTIVIVFTLTVMIVLGNLFKIDKHLSALIAVGTAVCGAAAIVAIAPLIKGKKEYTALAVACIAIIGTIGAIGYISLYPFLEMDPYNYGVLVGATLHELAHVIAASVPGGEVAIESAILVKLGRVALLIPVALLMGFLFSNKKSNHEKQERRALKDIPIPWFIFGFLGMSVLNTLGWLPNIFTDILIIISVYLLSMAMAGLGLSINFKDFKKIGFKPVLICIMGFIALVSLGPLLLHLLSPIWK